MAVSGSPSSNGDGTAPPSSTAPTAPTTPTIPTAGAPTPPTAKMLARAMALRCPVCGSGGLFGRRRGLLQLGLPQQCPGCALRFDREAGHWTGSWGLNVTVSFTALFVTLAVGLALAWPDPPGWGLAVVALGVALVLPVLFAPWSATLWLVIDLGFRPLEPGEAPDR